jgi:chloramphenicol-sensitive protein RarD
VIAGAVSISLNWGVYVYAVLSGHVAEAALGYFINPLVSVAIGVLVFKERLTIAARAALLVAGCAVLVLTLAQQRVPYIALGLAFSFAAYGVVKKLQPLPPATSLTAETVVVAPFALGYLGWHAVVTAGFVHTPTQWLLLALSGPMTAVPLLLFGAAAHRLPVISIGVLQYLTPIMQFVWAVAVRHEKLSAAAWLGFILVWLALMIFTADAIRRAARTRRANTIEEDR